MIFTEFIPWTAQDEQDERARVARLMESPRAVFVFGSNLAGVHGAGAADVARREYGARMKQGEGWSVRSYALPTKDEDIVTLPLDRIYRYVQRFKLFASLAPWHTFVVTRVGCGLAGYRDEHIAWMFHDCPANVELPLRWIGMQGGLD